MKRRRPKPLPLYRKLEMRDAIRCLAQVTPCYSSCETTPALSAMRWLTELIGSPEDVEALSGYILTSAAKDEAKNA